MIYGYARVSSAGQAIDGNSLEAQSELLKAKRRTENLFGCLHRHEAAST